MNYKIVAYIEAADESPSIRAILFEINSPGGSAVASDEIATAIKKTKKPTVALIRDAGASGAVNFVMGLSGKDVGVAYKERIDHGIYAVSVRGSKDCKVHLGKIVNVLATDLGGSGGGHDKACGAVIPKPKIKKFITELNKKIK